MGEAAVSLATAAGYTNAGTIEFLLDDNQNFYFLEMNTRLQVEHPVTELVTGLDLVHLQILVAEGKPLPFTQADIHLRGHAIECRIYAEDPDNQFFPSPGRITRLIESSGPGVRLDSGVYEGWTVPLDYDPMLSKLIAYAPTRLAAIETMLRALDETFIAGIATNISLFRRILNDPDFRAARIHTGYLDQLLKDRLSTPGPSQNVSGSGAPDSNSLARPISSSPLSLPPGSPNPLSPLPRPTTPAPQQPARGNNPPSAKVSAHDRPHSARRKILPR